ncbi:hypothetical protein F7725_018607 [Dissostichus mawsoni]|uniref:TYRO protein tyrosine kinase-binding protein n=1 Tax=Dissostichus mawsoni TaxID=36200 RepID=A0A7J5XS17_DISMA|nr:hypothetical protein F7725_018607 [Dissostichus mawsoni]
MSDALCIVGSYFGSTEGQQDCGSCYLINMGSVIGIIASDILLTIFIMISVFCFATHLKKRRKWDSHEGKKSTNIISFKENGYRTHRISLPGVTWNPIRCVQRSSAV